jgi:hypothetical protein
MKTIVLMGISCLLLAGVYGVMNKQDVVSKVLSFNQANSAVTLIGAEDLEKTSPSPDSTEKNSTTSNTLDDSHWIDDPLFEKAAGSELVIENEAAEMPAPGLKAAPESTNQASPKKDGEAPVKESTPAIKQLILELSPDTVAPRKKILTDVV